VPRYLVTGCAGFIGSTLAETLLDAGADVVGVDAFTDYYPRDRKEAQVAAAREHAAFEFAERDLGAGPLPEPLLEGVDGIFHLAARPGVRASWGAGFPGYLNDNLAATHAIVEAAAARDLPVVFASSSSIYGDALSYPTSEDTGPAPISPYGVTKLACEHLIDVYIRDFGLRCTALRYFTVYGPRQRPDMAFARLVGSLVGEPAFEVYGDGAQSRDFTYVQDAVAATILAMRKAPPGAIYNVGGGSEATLREAVAIVEELSGRTLDVGYGDVAAGDVRRTLADTERIRVEVGWEPSVDLRRGLTFMLEAVGAIVPAGPGTDER
jgi:nucleoside-diphosphate-sugar epimerase